MEGTPDLDTVLDVCGCKHRRIVLRVLEDQEPPVSIIDLTNAIIKHNHRTSEEKTPEETITQIQIGLHHAHLPKLAEAGVIQYDPERQVVESTAHVGGEESHISAILAIDSDRPTT